MTTGLYGLLICRIASIYSKLGESGGDTNVKLSDVQESPVHYRNIATFSVCSCSKLDCIQSHAVETRYPRRKLERLSA